MPFEGLPFLLRQDMVHRSSTTSIPWNRRRRNLHLLQFVAVVVPLAVITTKTLILLLPLLLLHPCRWRIVSAVLNSSKWLASLWKTLQLLGEEGRQRCLHGDRRHRRHCSGMAAASTAAAAVAAHLDMSLRWLPNRRSHLAATLRRGQRLCSGVGLQP
jgi:hypothetical protein